MPYPHTFVQKKNEMICSDCGMSQDYVYTFGVSDCPGPMIKMVTKKVTKTTRRRVPVTKSQGVSVETKRIGPDAADKVYPLVKHAVLEGWMVYGQAGVPRIGCTSIDNVEVYLVRRRIIPGKCLLPDPEQRGDRIE